MYTKWVHVQQINEIINKIDYRAWNRERERKYIKKCVFAAVVDGRLLS